MKLERLDEYLTTATAVIVGVAVAYWCGLLAGAGSIGTLLSLLGGFIFTALLLAMRQHVWMLIPICWSLTGQLPDIKGQPALRDVVVLGVSVATFMLVAFKVVRFKPKVHFVDFCLWAMLLYLCTVYLRNPTGGYILNSDRIGGRAYLNTAVATAAYWVLARAYLPSSGFGVGLLVGAMGVRMATGFLNIFANLVPRVIPFITRYYTGIDTSAYEIEGLPASAQQQENSGRLMYLLDIGEPVIRWQISAFPPLQILNPMRALLGCLPLFLRVSLLVSIILCMLSGFRSVVITMMAFIAISAMLQRGPTKFDRGDSFWSYLAFNIRVCWWVGRYGVLMLGFLLVLHVAHPLPLSIQRSLSFLPGHWDPIAVAEAEDSTRWRLFMWDQMLFTNKYVQSRWFGDGFGFSMRQFQMMQAMQKHGGPQEIQETFMIVGQVHSGPISAIRFVGYVGLTIYMFFIFGIAVEAWRLCKATVGTPFQAVTLFLCLPLIWEPINFFFIFGSYDYALPATVYAAGLLKMLRNSVTLHLSQNANSSPDEPVEPLRPQRKYAGPVRRPALAPRPAAP